MSLTVVDPTFERWKTMLDFQIRFIDALGNYRQRVAQAELLKAQADYEQAKTEELLTVVRLKQDLVHQMELDLQRLNQTRNWVQKRTTLVHSMVSKAAMIRRGQHLDAEMAGMVWQGYDFFMKMAPQEVLDTLLESTIDPAAREGSCFLLARDRTIHCQDAPPDCDNYLEFLEWVRERHYVPKIGSAAYRELLKSFGWIGGAAQLEIDRLQTSVDAMANNTYNAWQPVELLGVSAQAAKNSAKTSTGT